VQQAIFGYVNPVTCLFILLPKQHELADKNVSQRLDAAANQVSVED
jgi:hypothetical protein